MIDSTVRAVIKRGPSYKRKGTRGLKDKPEVCLGSLSIDTKSLTLAKEAPEDPKPLPPPFRSDSDGDESTLLRGFTTCRETN